MKCLYRSGRKAVEAVNHLAVAQGKAFEDAAHHLAACFGHRLVAGGTILLDCLFHVCRVGKLGIVRVYQAAERFAGVGFGYQFRVGSPAPFGTATLQQPHPTDVFQQADGSFHASLVGEVQCFGLLVDDRRVSFHTHQRPRAAAQVGEVTVGCRYGGYCRCRVVSGYGNHGHGSQSGHALHLFRQAAHPFAGKDKTPEVFLCQSQFLQQSPLHAAGSGIHQLGGGGDGIFRHHLAGQHVAQGIGHEEQFVGSFQRTVVVAAQGVELVQGVEVHHLDARPPVDPAARDACKESLWSTLRMWVAVGVGLAEKSAVFAHADKVHSPRVYTDGGDFNILFPGCQFQSFDDVSIQFVNVPMEVSSGFYQAVGEAVYLFHFQTVRSKRA